MRLAVVFPDKFFFNGKYYTTSSYFHYQLSQLQAHFDGIDLIVLLKNSQVEQATETLDATGIEVLGLPFCRNGWELHSIKVPHILCALAQLFNQKKNVWGGLLIYDSNIVTELAFAVAKLLKIPIILYSGGRIDLSKLEKSITKRFFERMVRNCGIRWHRAVFSFMVRHAPIIVTGSDLYNYYKDQGAVVHKIFSTTVPKDWIEDRIPDRTGKHVECFRLLTVCQISPIKGLEFLFEALARLSRQHPKFLLRVVGPARDKSYHANLIQRLDGLGLERMVEFVGPVRHENLPRFYSDTDLFVLPSLSEGIPKVIPEAMSKGLPIVATRVGGIHELITHGKEGILVEPRDVEGLSTAISTLAYNRSVYQQMAEASLLKAPQFTLEVQMEKLARLIKNIRATFY